MHTFSSFFPIHLIILPLLSLERWPIAATFQTHVKVFCGTADANHFSRRVSSQVSRRKCYMVEINAQEILLNFVRLFQYGLTTGGPGVMSVGWIVVSFFSMWNNFPPDCGHDELRTSSTVCWAGNG